MVERKIGEGGFGAVFRGRQVATGREVALKILHPHNVSDATVVARFRREAEACSKLSNPHTVTIYDFDETEDGILYLAMELLRGRALQDVERGEGPLDPRRVLAILGQVAEALGEAHALGIVHRDMKPENIMIESREGEDYVKVLDFGIAKIGDSGGKAVPALTAVGQTLGTLEFMSPEQLRGRPLDGRSDIYALGIVAYEMLTGLLPWREARVPIEVIKFHLETEPPAPSHLRRDLVDSARSSTSSCCECAPRIPPTATPMPPICACTSTRRCRRLDRRGGRGRVLRLLGHRRRDRRDPDRRRRLAARSALTGCGPSPRSRCYLTRVKKRPQRMASNQARSPSTEKSASAGPRDHHTMSARPLIRSCGTVPHTRESFELSRLSPMTKTCPRAPRCRTSLAGWPLALWITLCSLPSRVSSQRSQLLSRREAGVLVAARAPRCVRGASAGR